MAFNLYHFAPYIVTDPQSNATLANIDFAVQQGAFIGNFATPGNPATDVNPLFHFKQRDRQTYIFSSS